MLGVKLVSKQICLPGRIPLVLAAGSVTYQTKSGALESQLLASHQPLKVRKPLTLISNDQRQWLSC